jgi:hypothetical protein
MPDGAGADAGAAAFGLIAEELPVGLMGIVMIVILS